MTPDMSDFEPEVIREFFFDADGRPVSKGDPTIFRIEIHFLDEHVDEQRTYATVDPDPLDDIVDF